MNFCAEILLFSRAERAKLGGMNHNEKSVSGRAASARHPVSPLLTRPHTRRDFARFSLAALAGAGLLPAADLLHAADNDAAPAPGRPNSKVAGVQLGINVPYSFAAPRMSGDDILKNCVQLGFSAVELRTQPVEAFLGVPAELVSRKNHRGRRPETGAMAQSRSRWTG